jgi:hypothetical protein
MHNLARLHPDKGKAGRSTPCCNHRRTVHTPPWRIRLKARVDRTDQTVQFYTFKVTITTISMDFNVFLGINPRSLINTRFQPDAPRWCTVMYSSYPRAAGAPRGDQMIGTIIVSFCKPSVIGNQLRISKLPGGPRRVVQGRRGWRRAQQGSAQVLNAPHVSLTFILKIIARAPS